MTTMIVFTPMTTSDNNPDDKSQMKTQMTTQVRTPLLSLGYCCHLGLMENLKTIQTIL
jgi:hypothetical protein